MTTVAMENKYKRPLTYQTKRCVLLSPRSLKRKNETRNPKPYRHKALSSNDSTFLSTALLIPKISHISVVELSKKSRSFRCRSSEHIEQQQRFSSSTRPTNNSSPLNGESFPPKVFVGHSIYKGKAALTVDPKGPEFASLDSGAFKISKEGFVLLQFAPAAGVRQYDWSRKQVFSLSVVEIGTLISLGMKDGCEFFHDPFKGRSDEGKVRKVLKVEPLPDGSGHFFNLSVQNRILNMDDSIYIPVTRAEFAVLVAGFNFILPYLIGWHAFASTIKPEDASRTNSANPRAGADYEWSK